MVGAALPLEEKRLKRNAYMRQWKQDHKESVNALRRSWIAKNREKTRESSLRAYRKFKTNKPIQYLLTRARFRARRDGLAFDITINDILIPDPPICPVLGIAMISAGRGGGRRIWSDNSMTLDRMDPAKGYIRGNVQVISWRANRLKNDATLAEIEAIAAYMRGSFNAC